MSLSRDARATMASGVVIILSLMYSTFGPCVQGTPQFLEFGECSFTSMMPTLDISKFSGIWFIQESVPSEYTHIESCSMTNYTWKGDFMKIVEKGLNSEGRKIRQNSYVRPSPPPNEGEFLVEAEGVPAAPFQIISTDYFNYGCVYSCLSLMGFRASYAWIYTRQATPDVKYVQKCRDIFTEKEIDLTHLQPMKHDNDCPYMAKMPAIQAYMEPLMSQWKSEDVVATSTTTFSTTSSTTTTTAPTTTHPTTTTTESTTTTTTTATSTTTTKPVEVSEDPEVVITDETDSQHLQDMEISILEEEERLLHELEDERRRQQEERKRMEEERQREEEEWRRMEEERRREEEEEMRRLEEERRRMEDERTRLEEERRTMEKKMKENQEDIQELREDVRAEIRRNHRGSKHREGVYKEEEHTSSTSPLTHSFATLLMTLFVYALCRQ